MSTKQNESKELVQKKQSEITNIVLRKVDAFQKSGELKLPKDYIPENALKSAQLILSEQKDRSGNSVLQSCTQASIANALLKTVVWGLSPMKSQVYYIPYGQTLECSISYAGNIAIAKRYGGLKTIKANCIMEGDEFEFEIDSATGHRNVIKHKQTLESIGSKKILGAYAVYTLEDGTVDVEIMNFNQIEQSWKQGTGYGKSKVHENFKDQMALKTVINRACKLLIRSSDDKVLYDDEDKDLTKESVDAEIRENANEEIIDIESEEVIQNDAEDKQEEEKPKDASVTEKEEEKPRKLF